jgi:DNA (cytosine-5)-methyltransferase 1
MGGHLTRSGARSDEKLLPGQAKDMTTNWGPYEPAIRRWEAVLGRRAPSPTEPNSKGGQRLSPAFTEWMMGVPEGWVTGVPISRNEQLKACGNGVVPQQAEAALRDMLEAFGPQSSV